jgi:hypothetical protein
LTNIFIVFTVVGMAGLCFAFAAELAGGISWDVA